MNVYLKEEFKVSMLLNDNIFYLKNFILTTQIKIKIIFFSNKFNEKHLYNIKFFYKNDIE